MTPLSPTAFAGLLVGLSELILAYLSYSYSKLEPLKKLRLLAYGLTILAVKEITSGFLYLEASFYGRVVELLIESWGLVLVTYSIVSILNMNVKYFLALVFVLAITSSILTLIARNVLIMSISFNFFLPFLMALIFLKDYVYTRDRSLFLNSLGFLLYSLSIVIEASLMSMDMPLSLSVNSSLLMKLAAMVTILITFVR